MSEHDEQVGGAVALNTGCPLGPAVPPGPGSGTGSPLSAASNMLRATSLRGFVESDRHFLLRKRPREHSEPHPSASLRAHFCTAPDWQAAGSLQGFKARPSGTLSLRGQKFDRFDLERLVSAGRACFELSLSNASASVPSMDELPIPSARERLEETGNMLFGIALNSVGRIEIKRNGCR